MDVSTGAGQFSSSFTIAIWTAKMDMLVQREHKELVVVAAYTLWTPETVVAEDNEPQYGRSELVKDLCLKRVKRPLDQAFGAVRSCLAVRSAPEVHRS